jgi:hypothetical protein
MLSMRRSVWLILFILANATLAQDKTQRCAVDTSSSISTDRPQVTSSSIVVPCGTLQFENGFEGSQSGNRWGFDLPETSVRVGVAKKTEVRFGVPNYVRNGDTASGFSNGFGDMSVGFKQQLGPTPGKFDLSIIPAVSLPTGADALSSHGYDPSVQAPWSRALSKNWTAAGMLSFAAPTVGPRRDLTGQGSVYFDRQLTALCDAYVEYSGVFAQRTGPQHLIDFGSANKPTPHQQFDFHVGFGLSSAAPIYIVGVGYSVRFQIFHYK